MLPFYMRILCMTMRDVKSENSFLRIKLAGPSKNRSGLNAKVTLKYDGKTQFQDHSIYRGYLSTDGEILFTLVLGKTQMIDTILIEWPDGNNQTFYNTKVNQVLEAKYSDSQKNSDTDESPAFAGVCPGSFKIVGYKIQT